jgi:predicted amidohydrolase
MRVAAIQTVMGLSPAETIPAAEAAMEAAMQAAEKPDFLILPEYFSYYGLDQKSAAALAQPLPETPAFKMAQAFARRHQVSVQAGTILAKVETDERVENVSVVFGRDGEVLAQYRKIHLFDMEDVGNGPFRESDYIKPGNEIVTWQFEGVTFGTAICFDVRFPEQFRALRLKGAEIITLPAAYTELLARARAIESQCHVIACGLGGSVIVQGEEKSSYGHSVIVDAWGTILAKAGHDAATLTATLDMEQVQKVRKAIPLIQQCRLVGETVSPAN